jgi:hypothetical protein
MKTKYIFLALLMFSMTLSRADVLWPDGYLWVVIADSSALPISPTKTTNSALNAIFETYKVTNYFHRFDYHRIIMDGTERVEILSVYEIQYDSIAYYGSSRNTEIDLYGELRGSRLFHHIFNFIINDNEYLGEYNRSMEAVYLDSSARSVSDTSSANEDVNSILREFNVTKYVYPSSPPPYNFPFNYIEIRCENCNIIDLQIRLAELDTIFKGFELYGYPQIPGGGSNTGIFTREQFKVYPNPFSDYITIDNDKIKSITAYTVYGQQIYSQYEGSFRNIDLSFLSNGVYILKMETTDSKVSYHKIMKGGKS